MSLIRGPDEEEMRRKREWYHLSRPIFRISEDFRSSFIRAKSSRIKKMRVEEGEEKGERERGRNTEREVQVKGKGREFCWHSILFDRLEGSALIRKFFLSFILFFFLSFFLSPFFFLLSFFF